MSLTYTSTLRTWDDTIKAFGSYFNDEFDRIYQNFTDLDTSSTIFPIVIIDNEKPNLLFETDANDQNWMVSVNENKDSYFEISIGEEDENATDDIYTSLFSISPAGNVGIGTNEANDKFHIANGGIWLEDNQPGIVFETKQQSGTDYYNWRIAANDSQPNQLEFRLGEQDQYASDDEWVTKMYVNSDGDMVVGTTYIYGNGTIGINETSPDGILTINNNADKILTFKNSNVAHGVTSSDETDTYARLGIISSTNGGVNFCGYTEDEIAMNIFGVAINEDTTTSFSAVGTITVDYGVKSGTSITTLGSNSNGIVFRNNGLATHIFEASGDLELDGVSTDNAFDNENDLALIEVAKRKLANKSWHKDIIKEHEKRLEELGIMKNGFYSLRKMLGLLLGGEGQLYKMILAIGDKIGISEKKLLKIAMEK